VDPRPHYKTLGGMPPKRESAEEIKGSCLGREEVSEEVRV